MGKKAELLQGTHEILFLKAVGLGSILNATPEAL